MSLINSESYSLPVTIMDDGEGLQFVPWIIILPHIPTSTFSCDCGSWQETEENIYCCLLNHLQKHVESGSITALHIHDFEMSSFLKKKLQKRESKN